MTHLNIHQQGNLLICHDGNKQWCYDTNLWLSSTYGSHPTTPHRKMTPAQINYVKNNYLPKANAHIS